MLQIGLFYFLVSVENVGSLFQWIKQLKKQFCYVCLQLASVIKFKRFHDITKDLSFDFPKESKVTDFSFIEIIMPNHDDSLFASVCHQMRGLLPNNVLLNDLVIALQKGWVFW